MCIFYTIPFSLFSFSLRSPRERLLNAQDGVFGPKEPRLALKMLRSVAFHSVSCIIMQTIALRLVAKSAALRFRANYKVLLTLHTCGFCTHGFNHWRIAIFRKKFLLLLMCTRQISLWCLLLHWILQTYFICHDASKQYSIATTSMVFTLCFVLQVI